MARPLRGRRADLVYLDGNSLGRLPLATVERLRDVIAREWGGELIRGWSHWMDLPRRTGDRIADLLGSPRDPARRGNHVSIRHPDASRLCERLLAGGVVPDFRRPDSIRFGMSPLTTSFGDVHRGLDRLRALVAGESGW